MRSPAIISTLLLLLASARCAPPPDDRFETIRKLKILAVRVADPDLSPGQHTRVDVLLAAPTPVSASVFVTAVARDESRRVQRGRNDFESGAEGFASAGTTYNPGMLWGLPLAVTQVSLVRPGVASVFYAAPATPGIYSLAIAVKEGPPPLFLSRDDLAEQIRASLKAFKLVRVRAVGEPRNTNPVIESLRVTRRWRIEEQGDGLPPKTFALRPAGGFTMAVDQRVRIQARLRDETPERVSVTWWVTGGRVAGYGRQDFDLETSRDPGIYTIIALALDRQGGSDWYVQDIVMHPEQVVPEVSGQVSLLTLSGGRMTWLGFALAASATTVETALAQGPVVVRGLLTADLTSRLGWHLDAPVLVTDATTLGVPRLTAADIYSSPAVPIPIALRLDELVLRKEALP